VAEVPNGPSPARTRQKYRAVSPIADGLVKNFPELATDRDASDLSCPMGRLVFPQRDNAV